MDSFSSKRGRDDAGSKVAEAGLGYGEKEEMEDQSPRGGGEEGHLVCNEEGKIPLAGSPGLRVERGEERLIQLGNPGLNPMSWLISEPGWGSTASPFLHLSP